MERPMGRPTKLPKAWLDLAIAINGGEEEKCVPALQKALGGVPRSTVHRWADGERTPSRTTQLAINALFESYGFQGPYPTGALGTQEAAGPAPSERP